MLPTKLAITKKLFVVLIYYNIYIYIYNIYYIDRKFLHVAQSYHTSTHTNNKLCKNNTIPATLVTILTWAAEPENLHRPIARAGTLTRKKK